ncbi:MAG TPA: nitrilase-related carbon-nitrogen hydrolase [Planctomycetota bacterium]|nr:nitrilase-related carbon-nitrogen hydrolase [Planctomycetota bacterium]
MNDTLTIAAVQFEMTEDDKTRNLARMTELAAQAAGRGAEVVAFPEMCLSGYHYLTGLDRERLRAIAETADDGPAVRAMTAVARRHGIAIGFGLLERDGDRLYNTWVVVDDAGALFRHRKLHAFESSSISSGDRLALFDVKGWRCGVLICYDNNIPENMRVLALSGAELVFAPHQTGGFDIPRAGMGRIPLELWRKRAADPKPLHDAFIGPKGRAWIHKWLPSRAYDNNCWLAFVNGVGVDGPEVRVGCSAVFDPEGLVAAETTRAGDDIVLATLSKAARVGSLPSAHLASRRPGLYTRLIEPVAGVDARTARNRVSVEQIA